MRAIIFLNFLLKQGGAGGPAGLSRFWSVPFLCKIMEQPKSNNWFFKLERFEFGHQFPRRLLLASHSNSNEQRLHAMIGSFE